MLAGKIDAYVRFPQQLSLMETKALHGEIAVWLRPRLRNSQTKDICKCLQLCIIRSMIFKCSGKYSAPSMMTDERRTVVVRRWFFQE